MRVSEVMTRQVRLARPEQTIRDAARIMGEIDAGALPVGEQDRLVGMITDRDIAVRAVGIGKGPDTPVREVMSTDLRYCYEDEDTDDIAENMAEEQLRRLPVLDRNDRLVGILALGDLATEDERAAGDAVAGISRHGGLHSQSPRA